MIFDFTDDVHGIIVGDDDRVLYKFYTTVSPGVPHYLGDGLFINDSEAEAHVKTHYPAAYQSGIEMRAYERIKR